MNAAPTGFRQGLFSDLPGRERFLEQPDYRRQRAGAQIILRAGTAPENMEGFLPFLSLNDPGTQELLASLFDKAPALPEKAVALAVRELNSNKSLRICELGALACRSSALRKAFKHLFRCKSRKAQVAVACGMAPYDRTAAGILRNLLWDMRPGSAHLRGLLLAGCRCVYGKLAH